MTQFGTIWPVQTDLGRFGPVSIGLASLARLGWCGLVWPGLGRFGLVWAGLVRFGAVWIGFTWFGPVWSGLSLFRLVWAGLVSLSRFQRDNVGN